ncbi:MAG TPA: hypothetical protein VN239_09330 [Nitrososphaera sp.]|nr:hypothetical protein [Nitrososphaera sp.]
MRASCPFFPLSFKTIALAAAAIVIIHLAANVTITNAQQEQEQQQLLTSQPATSSVTQNRTTDTARLFESTSDNFRLQIPEGWVVRDVNNTGSVLAAEETQGYGILAQLCPAEGQEEGQQQGTTTNVNGSGSSSSCTQQPQGEIIHIIRFPNLGARLGIAVTDIRNTIPDSIFEYEIQKLQEVGYRNINVVNSTYMPIVLNYTTTEDVPAAEVIVPGRFVEMTYSTASAPDEIRRGYLFLTATNATPPNLETITGYGIFYEGAPGAPAARAQQTTPVPPGLVVVPAPVAQAFGSFELMASEEAVQDIVGAIAARQAVSIEPNDQAEDDDAGEDEE